MLVGGARLRHIGGRHESSDGSRGACGMGHGWRRRRPVLQRVATKWGAVVLGERCGPLDRHPPKDLVPHVRANGYFALGVDKVIVDGERRRVVRTPGAACCGRCALGTRGSPTVHPQPAPVRLSRIGNPRVSWLTGPVLNVLFVGGPNDCNCTKRWKRHGPPGLSLSP
jgi:hypothetical protein